MSKENKKMPSIFQMATNFAKDLGKYIKEGAPNVDHNQYLKRLEACNTCPHLRKEDMRCTLCGCAVEHKAKWKTTTCPDKPTRWEIIYKPPGTPNDEAARKAEATNKVLHEALEKGLWDPKNPKTASPILKAMGYGKNQVVMEDKNCKDCDDKKEGNSKGGNNKKGNTKEKKNNNKGSKP